MRHSNDKHAKDSDAHAVEIERLAKDTDKGHERVMLAACWRRAIQSALDWATGQDRLDKQSIRLDISVARPL